MNKNIKFIATAAIGVIALSSCGGAQGKVINMWTGFGASMTTALENVLETYSENHKDSGFDIIHTGQGGYDNLLSAITGSVSTRTYPQLAVAYPDHMAQYNESNILFALDGNIEKDKLNLDDFYPNYLQECKEISEGKVMGLPFNKSTEVLTTNKTFVDALIGLTKEAEGDDKIVKVPSTWQELEKFGDAANKVLNNAAVYTYDKESKTDKVTTKKGAFKAVICKSKTGEDYKVYESKTKVNPDYSIVVDLSTISSNDFRILSYDSQPNFFITIVRQWGGTYTKIEKDANGNSVGYMHYKSTETVSALKFFKGLFSKKYIGIPSDFGETSYTSTPFKAFKTIFTIGSSAGVSNCVPADNLFDVEINPIPFNAEKPDCKFVISQGTNLVMFKNTDEESRNETWNLLKTLAADPETNATFAKTSGYIPVTKSAYNTPTYQNYLKDTTLKGTAKTMRDAINVNFDEYLGENTAWIQFVDPGFVGSSSIRANVGSIMGALRDIKNANPTDDELNKLLDTYYQMNKPHIKK